MTGCTEAERALIEALMEPNITTRSTERVEAALTKVKFERLEKELPGWEEQFRTLLRASTEMDKKYGLISDRVGQCLTRDEFRKLVDKHYPKDPP